MPWHFYPDINFLRIFFCKLSEIVLLYGEIIVLKYNRVVTVVDLCYYQIRVLLDPVLKYLHAQFLPTILYKTNPFVISGWRSVSNLFPWILWITFRQKFFLHLIEPLLQSFPFHDRKNQQSSNWMWKNSQRIQNRCSLLFFALLYLQHYLRKILTIQMKLISNNIYIFEKKTNH